MKKFLTITILTLVSSFCLLAVFAPSTSAFDPFQPTATGGGGTDNTVCGQTNGQNQQSSVCVADGEENPITSPNGWINKIANIIAFIAGVAAIVVIMVGGFEYVRSGGESSKVSKAKNTILFAVVGLIVVVLARAAVSLAITKL